MTDDEYKDLFGNGNHSRDAVTWVFLFVGIILIILGVSFFSYTAYPAPGDECDGYEDTSCTSSVWVLSLEGDDLAEFETQEECEAWVEELGPQTPPFTEPVCRPEHVARNKT